MSFGGYDKYTTSGFSWLGDIPEHWKLKRLRYVAECLDGRRIPLNSVERASMAGDIPYWGANSVMDCVNKCLFDEELVLLGEDGAPFFEPNKIVAFYSSGPVWPNNHIHVLRTVEELSAWFLVHVLNITDYSGFVNGSTRDKLTQSAMAEIPMPFPPISEQVAITSFLDHETSKIDALITEQQRLIELLKEKRQAVISHAVTKGLNPDVRMKPSGVEWLGEVPEHWEVRRLKNLLSESLKYGANESAELDDPTLPRFVRITDIDEDGNLRDETFRSLPRDVAQPYLLHEGDVLLARSGATVGKSFKYSNRWGEACFAGYLIRARLKTQICLPDWLNYFCQTNAYWGYVVGSQIQATIQNVSAEKYGNLYLPVPSIGEQRAIIEALDDGLAKLKSLIDDAAKAIILLQERRTALISAAVTGKIDVRNYASTQKDAA